jgi:hypothetical protein
MNPYDYLPILAIVDDSDDKKSMKGCGDFDLAVVLFHLFKDEFVCVSVKANIWYTYKKHRWEEIDSGTTLRKAISMELRDMYRRKVSRIMDQQTQEQNEEAAKILKLKSDKILDICLRLARTNDKKNIMRDLIIPPPKCVDEKLPIAFVPILKQMKMFRRGVPSPLVKELGFNPHMKIKPLRNAIYNHLFKDEKEVSINEEIPYWSNENNKVEWSTVQISLYNEDDEEYIKMMELLKQKPEKAMEYFFPDEFKGIPSTPIKAKEWRKHCFACKSIICELYCIYNGRTLLSYF